MRHVRAPSCTLTGVSIFYWRNFKTLLNLMGTGEKEKGTCYFSAADALNRLTTVQTQEAAGGQVTTRTESYTYDALGNRLTRTIDGTTETYAYDLANQLTAIHQTNLQWPVVASFQYDVNGNLTSKATAEGILSLTYNAWDHLIQAQKDLGAAGELFAL